ncbi:hypothetical protein WB44_01280 [Synechococcus sp. WH 8020]|uniref:hypothetical protein n=1 Tax=Synechococcus sp. (strain WH8020) TaxID=32052 RepID=UPI00065279BF|nr:hypothetical protein [Synechococcus sp. WH 8020]AKN59983.1 hypothetical protein WB44_01280 [Synechococcus sp. WH 8020]
MAWHPYDLDHLAQEIVLKARNTDHDSLNQAYKMRASCAYGLERFWGEHLRLRANERAKAQFIADVWTGLVGIMARAGVMLPGEMLSNQDSEEAIQAVAEQLWRLDHQEQQATLSVLTSLCDAVVWWTQRLKTRKGGDL